MGAQARRVLLPVLPVHPTPFRPRIAEVKQCYDMQLPRCAAETGWDARPKPLRGMSQGRQEPSIWRALADAGLKPTENAVLDRLFEAFALDARGANV